MKKLSIVLITALAMGCSAGDDRDAAQDTEAEVPVGPGTDNSAIMPPDTPRTPEGEALPGTPARPDSL